MFSEHRPRVLVIGAGVSGLTTALCLQRRGLAVTVLSEKFAPSVTSVVAGALWEWPPSVCGRHHDEAALASAKAWCMTSYEAFNALAVDSATGVFMRRACFYFRRPVEEMPEELAKMNELRENVRDFAHGAQLIQQNGINQSGGIADAYSFLAPTIDTDAYLAWLHRELLAGGCELVAGRLEGDLTGQEGRLRELYRAGVVVNCAGLGSIELARDLDLDPHRGALIRVRNDGKSMPRVTEAHCVAHDTSQSGQGMIFIVPRGADMLLLGGLVEPGEWSLDIDLKNYPPITAMLERCVEFMPALAEAEIDETEPVRAGLRPFRRNNVRLEREPGTRIVHNYGHGGAGVTLSWGCAAETVGLVEQALEL